MRLAVRRSAGFAAIWLALPTYAVAEDWPQFRGPQRDGVYRGVETVPPFAATGPEVLWERAVGRGFSAPAVSGERVILFHRRGNLEVVEALDVANGKTLWESSSETRYRDDFGFDNGPRATPVIADGRVYTFGAQGFLSCLDLETGEKLWSRDTHSAFGVRKGFFGAASTPLVLDGKVLANVGGTLGSGIVALEAATGEMLWSATDHEASYASPVAARLDGKVQAVFFTRQGLVVVDPADGAISYERRWQSRSRASVNASTPLVREDVVFLSASYGTGAIAMRLCNRVIEELWSGESSLNNHYSSSVLAGGTVYGFHGRQEYGQSLRAIDLASGEVLWSEDGMKAGSVTLVGDRLVLLLESGELVLAKATADKFERTAQAQVLASETRAFLAISAGRVFARDTDTLVCLRLWDE